MLIKRAVLLAILTCSTGSIKLCVRMCLVLQVSVILSNRKQVWVCCARTAHSSGVPAVPVVPLSHQPHHQILQFCQLRLGRQEAKQQGDTQTNCK